MTSSPCPEWRVTLRLATRQTGRGQMLETTRDDRAGVAGRYDKVLEPQVLEAMRRGFSQLNKGMVPLWRLGLGRMMNVWPAGFGQLLVIEHVGRRSGTRYRTPVNYAAIDGDVYCVAALGNAPTGTATCSPRPTSRCGSRTAAGWRRLKMPRKTGGASSWSGRHSSTRVSWRRSSACTPAR